MIEFFLVQVLLAGARLLMRDVKLVCLLFLRAK